jgi:hypothetical protein
MEFNSSERMSIRDEEETGTPREVIARAERLLAASHRQSNIVTFEPMTINQVHKITKQGASIENETKQGPSGGKF